MTIDNHETPLLIVRTTVNNPDIIFKDFQQVCYDKLYSHGSELQKGFPYHVFPLIGQTHCFYCHRVSLLQYFRENAKDYTKNIVLTNKNIF